MRARLSFFNDSPPPLFSMQVGRLDVAVPLQLQRREIERTQDEDGEQVRFTFLTKQKMHNIHVPADTDFSSKMIHRHKVCV